jgi:hypothetical protein
MTKNTVTQRGLLFEQSTWSIVFLTLWSLLEAAQFLFIVIFSFFCLRGFVSMPPGLIFCSFFILMVSAMYAGALRRFGPQLSQKDFTRRIIELTTNNLFWLVLQTCAVTSSWGMAQSRWAYPVFTAGLAGAVTSRIFWNRLSPAINGFYFHMMHRDSDLRWVRIWDGVFPVILIILIGVPDINYVLKEILVTDSFYHFDSLLMAPGWAYLNGLTLNMDVTSQYSMVIPAVISRLADMSGGFSYHNVLAVLIGLSAAYFIALYFVFRSWLKSALWATFGILLAIKLHMFHAGVSPVIWRYPSATVMRYWFDWIALYAISRHCDSFSRRYLWLAFVSAGMALAYMLDTGIYLTFTVYVYLGAYILARPQHQREFRYPQDIFLLLALILTPVVTALGVLYGIQGPSIFTRELWMNALEFAGLFMQGWGAMPMHESLRSGHLFIFLMGFFMPIVYVWTLIFVGGRCLTGRAPWRDFFIVFVSVYGLCLFQYFINRSALSSYYVVCIPYVFVLCYWLNALSERLSLRSRRYVSLSAVVLMASVLGTSAMFTEYPNYLSQSFNKQLENYLDGGMDVNRDAQLIERLTAPHEQVALISRFETAILMQARRKPFFYYFPLMESTPLHMPTSGRNYLYTTTRLNRIIHQLQGKRPKYIFIEKSLVKKQTPPAGKQTTSMKVLIQYVNSHYDHDADGEYLTAFKLRL